MSEDPFSHVHIPVWKRFELGDVVSTRIDIAAVMGCKSQAIRCRRDFLHDGWGSDLLPPHEHTGARLREHLNSAGKREIRRSIGQLTNAWLEHHDDNIFSLAAMDIRMRGEPFEPHEFSSDEWTGVNLYLEIRARPELIQAGLSRQN